MTDALFGCVCDRCGRLYVQPRFPHGCLCPGCYSGDSEATEPERLPDRARLSDISLAAS
jgi:uncharacterized OB-fold protein